MRLAWIETLASQLVSLDICNAQCISKVTQVPAFENASSSSAATFHDNVIAKVRAYSRNQGLNWNILQHPGVEFAWMHKKVKKKLKTEMIEMEIEMETFFDIFGSYVKSEL